jgi:hypothetical protein
MFLENIFSNLIQKFLSLKWALVMNGVLIEDTLDQSEKELPGLLENLEIVELNSEQRNKWIYIC